jgi:L-lysine exporter family protein LysE/ArgO
MRQAQLTPQGNLAMTAAFSGMLLSLSLIIAIGPQNVHVLRMGLLRQHVGLTVAACAITDLILIGLGVAGLAQLGNLSLAVQGLMIGAAILFLLHYGWGAARRVRANQYQGLSAQGQRGASPTASTSHDATTAPKPAHATAHTCTDRSAQTPTPVPTRKQALGAALAFSWLNPHAWLDTAVLIGTASLAYTQPDNWLFGAGAAAGSALWFIALGLGAQLLAHKLARPAVWRGIDAVVALTMWGTAVWLAVGLLKAH